ncbi:hypothetical protein ACQKOE_09985 [Novosphingobium sp. NPDC080210]|uniref:hypothetical protein n=1 Tax=Novosphingobium sp. NPDC080210 TaxID=3390596 RepID=UPI003D01B599
MSYVIVKFAVPSLAADCLYVVNGEAAGVDARNAPFSYTVGDFSLACELAQEASGRFAHCAAYAVFNVTGMSYAWDVGGVPAVLNPSSPFCALAPVYVPAPSAGLWARYGSTWERLPFMLGNSSPAVAPAALPTFDPSAAVPIPAPIPGPGPVANPHLAAPAVAPAAPTVRFEVRAGLVGTDRDGWSAVMDFDNGKDAGAWVSANRASFTEAGKALVIVKVEASAVASDWRERERNRLEDGTYTALPGEWAVHIAEFYPDHFAHVAQSDKRKVAFTESESSGERDKQKVLSASAYVERFFGDTASFYWMSERRARFVADMLGDSVKPLFAPLGDADAMEEIYRATEGGPAHGCMSYSERSYSSPFHPVRVYAMGGDITVAFLRSHSAEDSGVNPDAVWDGDGDVIARCLVWPEQKQFGRVYGSTENQRLLRTALEAQGYSSGDLSGAKIAKVEAGSSYVMPYLDIGGGQVEDCGTYFEVGGDLCATRTDGLLESGYCCERCGEMVPEDEISTVHTSRRNTESWCDSCRDDGASWSEYDEEYIADHCTEQFIPSGARWPETISIWALENMGAVYVEEHGACCEDAFVCDDCGEAFHNDDCSELSDVCVSCYDERKAQEEEEAEDTAAAQAA